MAGRTFELLTYKLKLRDDDARVYYSCRLRYSAHRSFSNTNFHDIMSKYRTLADVHIVHL